MARKKNRGKLAKKARGAMKRVTGAVQKVNVIRQGNAATAPGGDRSAKGRYGAVSKRSRGRKRRR